MKHNGKTVKLLEQAKVILEASETPMTVRQCYYQLVSVHAIKNSKAEYGKVSRLLNFGRTEGIIGWDLIEDRIRRPHTVSMWQGIEDFAQTCRNAYRKDVWTEQPGYVEVCLEKDALSGIFLDSLNSYGVTLCVGRGYDSISSLKAMADRLIQKEQQGKTTTILSFGDFDPSGEDIFRNLQDGLERFGVKNVTCKRCAILKEDILTYSLPPDTAKATDKRCQTFMDKNGCMDTVELDALPLPILKQRIVSQVEGCLDMQLLEATKQQQEQERQAIIEKLK